MVASEGKATSRLPSSLDVCLKKDPDPNVLQDEPFSTFLNDLQRSSAQTSAHLVKYSQARTKISPIDPRLLTYLSQKMTIFGANTHSCTQM